MFRAKLAGLSAGILFASTLLCSCGGVPKVHYYTVAMPTVAPAADAKTSYVLDIQRFRAPQVLRDDRILYYQSPTQLNFYEYHRWTTSPADMTADLVARRLRGMDFFKEVRLYPHNKPGDYMLKGHLLNFEEVDYESGGSVRVGLEMTLVRARDNQSVWSASRETTRSVQGKGVEAYVNSMSDATSQMLNEMLPAMAAAVERDSTAEPQAAK